MLKAKIYKTNILDHSKSVERVKQIDNQLISLSNSSVNIRYNNGAVKKYDLRFSEKDFSTSTYIGKFKNGNSFRLIKPNKFALNNLKKRFKCISAFTIASLSPDGYAIHFVLTKTDNNDDIPIISRSNIEQKQRLVQGAFIANQNGLMPNFLEYTKRLLNLIQNSSEFEQMDKGLHVLKMIRRNINLYSYEEKKKVLK